MGTTESKTFYDQHPFDWAPVEGASLRAVVSRPLADFIESLNPDSLVLDIGCGPGRVLGFLARRGIRCIGLDRSGVSVEMAAARCDRPGVVGDNLRLPFADESADVVISDGVIHHTGNPQAAFLENCRILKPGGRMYLAVYKPFGRYPWLYKFPGAAIRTGLRHAWARPLVLAFARAPYFLVHFIRSKGRRTWAGARNLFYDYFVTPQISFLSREAVKQWCANGSVTLARYDENRGSNVHAFYVVKQAQHPAARGSDARPATEAMLAGRRGAHEPKRRHEDCAHSRG